MRLVRKFNRPFPSARLRLLLRVPTINSPWDVPYARLPFRARGRHPSGFASAVACSSQSGTCGSHRQRQPPHVRWMSICFSTNRWMLSCLSAISTTANETSMKTARFLAEQVRRLHAAGIKVFVIRGNHDALSPSLDSFFPRSVRLFGGRADAVDRARPWGAANRRARAQLHEASCARRSSLEVSGARRRHDEHQTACILAWTALGHGRLCPLPCDGFRLLRLPVLGARAEPRAFRRLKVPADRDAGHPSAIPVKAGPIRDAGGGSDDGTIIVAEHIVSVAQFEHVLVDALRAENSSISSPASRPRSVKPPIGRNPTMSSARLALSGATPLAWTIRRDAVFCTLKPRADPRRSGTSRSKSQNGLPAAGIRHTQRQRRSRRRAQTDDERGRRRLEAFRAKANGIVNDLLTQLPPESRRTLGSGTMPVLPCSSGSCPQKAPKRCWPGSPRRIPTGHANARPEAWTSPLRAFH